MTESTRVLESATAYYFGEFKSFALLLNGTGGNKTITKLEKQKVHQTRMSYDSLAIPLLDIANIHRDVMTIILVTNIA